MFSLAKNTSKRKGLGEIASELGRHVPVISREVKKRSIVVDKGEYGRLKNRCTHRNTCQFYGICEEKPNCTRKCSTCSQSSQNCKSYREEICHKLLEVPYVCNGCSQRSTCVLRKKYMNIKNRISITVI